MLKLIHFQLNQENSRREILAGLTTFLTMAYIIIVTPNILGATGMPVHAVFTATCLTTTIGCLLLGLFANYPIAISSGIALNVYLAYVMVQKLKFSWQTSLGAIVVAGVILLLLSMSKIRHYLINDIPTSLSHAISIGLGLFIVLIALHNIGVPIPGLNTVIPTRLFAHIVMASIGLIAISVFYYWRVPGAILLGIVITTLLAFVFKLSDYHGLFALPPSLSPTLFKLSFHGLWSTKGIDAIFSLVFVTLFDCTGTLFGLLGHAGFLNKPDWQPRFSAALIANACATIFAGLVGNASTSSYLESATGMRAGGRTGLTTMTIAALFILTLFLSPLADTIPIFAAAPALFFAGCLMLGNVKAINWKDYSEWLPSAIITLMIPATFSIANGVGAGIIAYTALKITRKKFDEINQTLIILSLLFIVYFSIKSF